MTIDDFHSEADELALEIEQKIQETKQFLAALPEFEPRQSSPLNVKAFKHNH